MATITRGITFATGDTVTAAKLNQLVDSATLTDVDRGDVASGTTIITVSGSQPTSMVTGEAWFDTTPLQEKLKVKLASQAIPLSAGSGVELHLKNSANSDAALGSVIILDKGEGEAFDSTTTANDTEILGVVADDAGISQNATGRVQTQGKARILTTGAIALGDFLHTSTTAWKGAGTATQAVGSFGRALTADPAGTNGFVTALLWGTPASVVPQNTLILWDQNDTCPSGFTEQVAAGYADKFLKIVSTNPATSPNGTAATSGTHGLETTVGINIYGDTLYTHEVYRTSDTNDPDDDDRSAPEATGLVIDKKFTNAASGNMRLGDPASEADSGNHQHSLNNLTNQPAYRKVKICKKD